MLTPGLIVRVLISLCLPLTGASAQSAPDFSHCPPPASVGDMNSPDEAIARQAALEFAESTLCRYEVIRAFAARTVSAGDIDFFDSLISYTADFRQTILSRSTYPNRQILQRLRDPRFADRLKDWQDVHTYVTLTLDIYNEDNCPQEKIDGLCVRSTMFTMLQGQGKDPRAEFERIGRDTRVKKIDPWFLIKQVVVDDSALSETSDRLRRTARDTRRAYQLARETHELRQEQLEQAEITAAKNIAEMSQGPARLRVELDKLRSENLPDLESIRTSAAYRNLSERAGQLAERHGQIDGALGYLYENTNENDQAGNRRISELEGEQAAIDSEIRELVQAQQDLLLPNPDPETQARLEDMADELELAERDLQRRIDRETREVDAARRLAYEAEDDMATKEGPYQEADQALRLFLADTEYIIESVTSVDAKILLDSEDIREQIARLNIEIAQWRALTNEAGRVRNQARHKMLDAGQAADDYGLFLLQAGRRSIAAQFAVELAASTAKMAYATAKGGIYGAAAEGVGQTLSNIFFPPSFYETKGGKLLYDKETGNIISPTAPDDPSAQYTVWDTIGLSAVVKQGAKRIAKNVSSTVIKPATRALLVDVQKSVADKAHEDLTEALMRDVLNPGAEIPNTLQEALFRETEMLSALEKDLVEANQRAGRLNLDVKGLKSFLIGMGESLAKDYLKKSAADVIEQPYFQRYLEAQARLSQSTRLFIAAGDRYYSYEQTLLLLRELRDGFVEALDPEADQVFELNDPFFADPGYQIWLELKEGQNARLRADLELGGIPLERDPSSTAYMWRLPEDSLERFTSDLPERLEIRIKLKE